MRFKVYLPSIDEKSNVGQGLFQILLYTFEDTEVCLYTNNENNLDTSFIHKFAKDFNIRLTVRGVGRGLFNLLQKRFIKTFAKKVFSIYSKIKRFFFVFRYAIKCVTLIRNKILSFIDGNLKFHFNDDGIIFLSPLHVPVLYKPQPNDVLVFADFLVIDFPETIEKSSKELLATRFQDLLSKFNNIVCFSNHVRQCHLIDYFNVDPSKIKVIKHSLHDMSVLWHSEKFQKFSSIKSIEYLQNKVIINGAGKTIKDLFKRNFIITSSTYRADYKNFKQVESLINSGWLESTNTFMFLTHVPEEKVNELLSNPFVYFAKERIDNKALGQLYSLAALALHVSLFEGGVNVAPFSEAVSVGTPCIAAQSKATIEAELAEEWTFDGNSFDSMVVCLDNAFMNLSGLHKSQLNYYIDYDKKYDVKYKRLNWSSYGEA